MKLYEPPVPEPHLIPVEAHWQPKDWQRYRQKATLRVHIFQNEPRAGSLTPSEASDMGELSVPTVSVDEYGHLSYGQGRS